MFKRLVAVATTTALTVAMAVSAFAAGSVSADEQKILDVLKDNGIAEGSAYYNEAKKMLEDESINVSAADATTAIANIKEVKKLVDEKGYTTIDQIKADTTVLNKVKEKVNATASLKSIDVKVNWDATSSKPSVATKDGKILNTAGNAKSEIKATGVDFSTTAAVVAGLGLSVAGIAVIAKKKDLVNA